MKRIVFHSNQLSLRGTEVALYDYALYNREILGNESVIVYAGQSAANDRDVIGKFRRSFPVHAYDEFPEVDRLVERERADLFYTIKAGHRDGLVSRSVPSLVHAVFPSRPSDFHGSALAFISDWLSAYCSNRRVPVVPHIVALPRVGGDLREELGIPGNAMVFGCHGGADSFDIPFVRHCVSEAVLRRADVHFVFLNIAPFTSHDRVMFLDGTPDMGRKVKFINTCDAMLHGRNRGETFGLACAEFSACNKPVLTYERSGERNHIEALGDAAFLYRGPRSLMTLLLGLSPADIRGKDWDRYSERFSPGRVMADFRDSFIDRALRRGVRDDAGVALDCRDRAMIGAHRLRARLRKYERRLPG